MSTGFGRNTIRSTADATAAFVSRKAEVGTMLAQFRALSGDHFGYDPKESPGPTSAPSSMTPTASSASPT
jgi:hypothetical protein